MKKCNLCTSSLVPGGTRMASLKRLRYNITNRNMPSCSSTELAAGGPSS